jgi:hypothetical protein
MEAVQAVAVEHQQLVKMLLQINNQVQVETV